MADRTLADISEAMRDIDFCMLSTRDGDGAIAARPMSNNREVEFGGDTFFFTDGNTAKVRQIEADPQVGLAFQGKAGMFGKPGMFIAVNGRAELIRDKAEFEKHWVADLDRWFEQGVDTPGLALIRVRAERVHYWDGGDEGVLRL